MRLALIVALITLPVSSAYAGKGGFLIPPVEVDFGVGVPVGPATESVGPSTEILAGIHWASLYWKPTRFDVGIGYVGSFRKVDHTSRFEDEDLAIHGGYLSLGTTIASGRNWRTWFTARGELLRAYDGTRELSALGAALRVGTELYGSTLSGGRNAAIVGTVALGIYAEVTYRDVPVEYGQHGVTTGVSLRLPLLAAGG